MLELKGISLSFGEKSVLKDQSLTLRPGQRLALMGPSGCGKTTLLRVALGLIKPGRGTVRNTFGNVGVVFQEPRLLPWRTALENVNLVLGDQPQTRETAAGFLARVGLSDALDKYPRELSGGMEQRVALARALAIGADCLVLDEPFKAMDETLRREVMALVNRSEAAILLVTHDPQEASFLGCEILELK